MNSLGIFGTTLPIVTVSLFALHGVCRLEWTSVRRAHHARQDVRYFDAGAHVILVPVGIQLRLDGVPQFLVDDGFVQSGIVIFLVLGFTEKDSVAKQGM